MSLHPTGDEMSKFSLLVRVHKPTQQALQGLIASLEAQTESDWTLHLVVDGGNAQDRAAAELAAANSPQVQVLFRPASQHLAMVANTSMLSEELGDWVGFLDQHDQLEPDTLESCATAAQLNPLAQVIYTGEASRTGYGHVSFRNIKPLVLDPVRLRSQEYLGSLSFIRTAALREMGGYSPTSSDVPTHDAYLRILERWGTEAFVNVPKLLCFHYRTYLEPEVTDPRFKPFRGRYDLQAIKDHLARTRQPARVKQEHGRPVISVRLPRPPSVTVLQMLGDDAEEGLERIHSLNNTINYRPVNVVLVHRGSNPEAQADYHMLARSLRWTYQRESAETSVPALVNARLPTEDSDYLVLLDGRSVTRSWLHQLVELAQLPDVAAVGGRLASARQLESPGILGYKYQGWDWNSAGRFAHLTVPHCTGALSPAGALFDTRVLRELGGFDEMLPMLFGMDYSLRATAAGHLLVQVPSAHLQVSEPEEILARERLIFLNRWRTWKDPYDLHFVHG